MHHTTSTDAVFILHVCQLNTHCIFPNTLCLRASYVFAYRIGFVDQLSIVCRPGLLGVRVPKLMYLGHLPIACRSELLGVMAPRFRSRLLVIRVSGYLSSGT